MAFQSRQNCQNNFCMFKTNFTCSKRFLPAQSEYCMLKTADIAFPKAEVCACSTTGQNYQTEILHRRHAQHLNTRTIFSTARICMLNTWTKFSTAHICMLNTWTKFSAPIIACATEIIAFSTVIIACSTTIFACSRRQILLAQQRLLRVQRGGELRLLHN